ncbi:MAG: TRAP transporter large permease [Deltaproteobacteria bacterium]|nr:TRAP transporter large permease [Deltaproteobacteria bacterium]
MSPETIALISVLFVFTFILVGVHVGIALASVSVLGIWAITGKASVAINLLQTTAYSAVMDYVFAVVPLFVLMGLFSTLSGATKELFTSAEFFLGRFKGGLGIATVIANAIFAAITGVSVASAAVFSKIAFPEMQRLKYERKFSLGIVAGSAILGMLIPPSILMIVYGVLTEMSIGKLFMAGFIPGIVVSAVLSIGIRTMIYLKPEIGGLTEKAKPFTVILVMGGIWGGLFTPTEAGAVGAAGGFLLVVVKGKFNLKGIWHVLLDGGQTTASIFLLLICAQMYSRMLTISGLAAKVTDTAISLPVPPIFIIFGFIVVFLILGCIIDSVSIILLTIPIMHPVAVKLGYDPIWFAIVSIITIEIGLLTPPFGMVVFAMKSALGDQAKIEEIFQGSLPFILMLFLSLLIIMAFPILSTFLPSLM